MPSHRFITNQKVGENVPLNQSFVRKVRNFINNFTVIGGNFYFDGTTPKLIISPSTSKHQHPFIVSSAGYGEDELPQVSVGSGVFIAGLHAQGYYTTPTGPGTILIDSAEEEVPTGMVEMARTTLSNLPLNSKTAILFEVDYVRKGCKKGSDPDDPLTIAVADPSDTDIFLKQWYCNGVAFAQSECTESSGRITLLDIAFSYLPASKVYYPIAVVTTGAEGITNIRQIVRSDFREPLSGSLEAYTA